MFAAVKIGGAARRRQHGHRQGARAGAALGAQDGRTDRRRVPARGVQRPGRRQGMRTGAVAHPLVAKVTLIGSVPTGSAIMRAAADTLKPVLLELGGKNALIMFPDADPDRRSQTRCRGHELHVVRPVVRLHQPAFVHESIHDRVLDRSGRHNPRSFEPGMPTDWRRRWAPSSAARNTTGSSASSKSAKEEGARLVCGGSAPDAPGSPMGSSSSRRCSPTSRPR